MTIKKLAKLGNSQAVVIDKQMLAQLGLSEGDEVQVTLHGYQLVITPVQPHLPENTFRDSFERIVKKYDELFRRLA